MKFNRYFIRAAFSSLFLIVSFLSARAINNNYTDFLDSCIRYDNAWYYEGDLRIPVSFDLKSDQETIDEAYFAALLQRDLYESEKAYKMLHESVKGKILDTDIARNLYQPYASAIESRYHYVCSTLMPAAWFVDYLYYKSLAELVNRNYKYEKKDTVILLAGGDGSGKTSSVRKLGLSAVEEAAIIKDSTMSSDFEFHRNMVDKTLALGLNVTLIYVFRPIELALKGNIARAQIIGRVRPLMEIVEAHYKAQQNILKLSEYFGDRINILVIDNSRTFEEVALINDGIEFLKEPSVLYESQDAVLIRALTVYNNMDKESIPEFIRNLLERKLNPDTLEEGFVLESEKTRWVNYLKNILSNIVIKLGFSESNSKTDL